MTDLYPSYFPIDLASARDAAPFWEGCREKRLLLCRCAVCELWIHFPRAICPRCWSDRIDRREASGDATLYTYVVDRDGRAHGLAELAEQAGLRVPGALVGLSADRWQLDMPLRLTWTDHRGLPVPAFEPRSVADT